MEETNDENSFRSDTYEDGQDEASQKATNSEEKIAYPVTKYVLLVSLIAAVPLADYILGPFYVFLSILIFSISIYLVYFKGLTISFKSPDQVHNKTNATSTSSVQTALVTDTEYSKELDVKVKKSNEKESKHPINDRNTPFVHAEMLQMPKHRLRIISDKVETTDPPVHLLPLTAVLTMDEFRLKKCELGDRSLGKTEKVIMIVGATGAGKTTLINGMINYVLGVDWQDNFRFKIIPDQDEIKEKSQAVSQTKWITAYTIHHQKGFAVPYTLTIIDTPGFGDTKGIKEDEKTMRQISKFFNSQGRDGIDHLTAVGIVVQASSARLTHTQRFIFDSVLSIFGKNIENNIFVMTTFSDGQTPPVLTALQVAGVPFYGKYFKFNNSALFATKNSATATSFDDMFWSMGRESFRLFFDHLEKVEDQSVVLTKHVLEERRCLELSVEGIHKQLDAGLRTLERLETEVGVLKRHQHDIDTNKHFTYFVNEDVVKKEEIPPGKYITNCITCNFTCHYPCMLPEDSSKQRCNAIKDNNCQVCPSKCFWDKHKNMSYRLIVITKRVNKTSEELKTKYEKAMGEKLTVEQLIQEVVNEFQNVQIHVLYLADRIRKSIMHLHDIALKPYPLSALEYIDILIASEKNECRQGWRDRVKQLQTARKQAEIIYNVGGDNFDPFQKYKEKYELYLKQGLKPNLAALLNTLQLGNENLRNSATELGVQHMID